MKKYLKYLPILIILILMIITYIYGGFDFLSFDSLKKYHLILQQYLNNHPVVFPIIFMLVYIIAAALSIPGAVFLTMLSGFLFNQPMATIYVVISATIGACIIFLSAKTALGDILKKKAGKLLRKISAGFSKNAANYMLFLRLVPLFPFWLVNIAPAFFNVGFFTYFWTTLVGIIPGSFVFAQAGTGLSSLLKQEEVTISSFFTIEIKIALIALGIFALIPVIYKKIKEKNVRH